MHGIEFLQDLAIVMIVAGIVTALFHRLRQPVVLGYIVAGAIIGPHTPPFQLITNEHSIETLSELGVILLMFSLGLHFSIRKLISVGSTATIAALLEIVVMVLLGYVIGRAFGWRHMDAIFLGAILSISSTTIIVKALGDLGMTKKPFAGLIFGILIVEDVLAIAMLALFSGIATTGSLAVGDVVHTLGRLGIFLAVVMVTGLLAVPPILRSIARSRSDEVMLTVSLGLCFGVSLVAARMGYSVALGAFLIGAVVAETREVGKVSILIEPVRDMFSAIFFVAVGMMIDPHVLTEHWVAIGVITVAVVVGKVFACSTGTFIAGHDPRTSLRVGMAVSQIGEFSFIIAQLGLSLKVTGPHLYPIAVAVSAVTTLLTPYLIRSSDPLYDWIERIAPPRWGTYLATYEHWITRASQSRGGTGEQVRKLLRRWALQIALNMALVSGIFIADAWMGSRAGTHWPNLPAWTGGPHALVWLTGAVVALPLLIASIRKLRAAAMVLAELSVTRQAAQGQTVAARKVVANTILVAGCGGILLWILVISSAILPPWPVLVGLLAVVVLVGIVMWQSFVRLYARAQIALHETLATEHEEHLEEPAPPLPPLLREAVLRTAVVAAGSASDGKLIRELALRTRTGASVVGIEREGMPIINPGPDEELRAGDRVLLLGTAPQLQTATPLLESPA